MTIFGKKIHRRVLASCLLATGAFCVLLYGQDAYTSLIDESNSLARQGNFIEAFAKAQDAVKLNPARFEGYYFEAYALLSRGMTNEARPLADQALSRAPNDRKAEVKLLVDSIARSGSLDQQLKVADDAVRNGLYGRAADAYTAAWNLDTTNDAVGLKAAQQWLRINDNPRAAEILNQLHDHPHNVQLAPEVERTLAAARPGFDSDYAGRCLSLNQRGVAVAGGRGVKTKAGGPVASTALPAVAEDDESYILRLRQCAVLKPGELDPPLRLAVFYANNRNDFTNAKTWFYAAVRTGKLRLENVLGSRAFQSPEFTPIIRDALGPQAVEAIARQVQTQNAVAQQQAAVDSRNRQISDAARAFTEAAVRAAQQRLPATLAQLKQLLSGTFDYHSYGESSYKVGLKRQVTAASGCSISYTEEQKIGSTDRHVITFSLTGLAAQVNPKPRSQTRPSMYWINISSGPATFDSFYNGKHSSDYPKTEQHGRLSPEVNDKNVALQIARLLNDASSACPLPIPAAIQTRFGSVSAFVPLPDGHFAVISDRTHNLEVVSSFQDDFFSSASETTHTYIGVRFEDGTLVATTDAGQTITLDPETLKVVYK